MKKERTRKTVTYEDAVEILQRANPYNGDSRNWPNVLELAVSALKDADELDTVYDKGYSDGWSDGWNEREHSGYEDGFADGISLAGVD